jgi:hypothetical protein
MGPVRIELSMSGQRCASGLHRSATGNPSGDRAERAPAALDAGAGPADDGFDVGSGNPFQQAQREFRQRGLWTDDVGRRRAHRIAGALDPTGGISAATTVRRGLLDLFA